MMTCFQRFVCLRKFHSLYPDVCKGFLADRGVAGPLFGLESTEIPGFRTDLPLYHGGTLFQRLGRKEIYEKGEKGCLRYWADKRKFGHNDQKAAANINITAFMANLERMATEVQTNGGTPVHLLS